MRRLPEGDMVVHQLPPYSMAVWFGDGHRNMISPFFFFFGSYGIWGFPLRSYYLMAACVMATCHARIGWGVLSSDETFHFSHIFWGASFLNPLCSFSMLTFSKFQCSLLQIPQLPMCFTTVISVLTPLIYHFHFLFLVCPFVFLVLSFLLKFYLFPFSVLCSLFELCFFYSLFDGRFWY